MKSIVLSLTLYLATYLMGCQSADSKLHQPSYVFTVQKQNAVKEYFAGNNWNYPFQMDSLSPMHFYEYSDSPQVFVDSNQIQFRRTLLFTKAVKYFINNGIDSTCGHRFCNPSMYHRGKTIYYRLFVQKYRNNTNPNAGCECAELDSGRVLGYRCLMEFKILPKDSLVYEGCMD